jgi:hypothetical protein
MLPNPIRALQQTSVCHRETSTTRVLCMPSFRAQYPHIRCGCSLQQIPAEQIACMPHPPADHPMNHQTIQLVSQPKHEPPHYRLTTQMLHARPRASPQMLGLHLAASICSITWPTCHHVLWLMSNINTIARLSTDKHHHLPHIGHHHLSEPISTTTFLN